MKHVFIVVHFSSKRAINNSLMWAFTFVLLAGLALQINAATRCVKFPDEAWRQGKRYRFNGKEYALMGYHVSLAKNKESIEQDGIKKANRATRFGDGIYLGYDVPHLLQTYPQWSPSAPDKIFCSVFAPIEKLSSVNWCPLFTTRVKKSQDITQNAIKAVHRDCSRQDYLGRPRYVVITEDLQSDLFVKCEDVGDQNNFKPTYRNPTYAKLSSKHGAECTLHGFPGEAVSKQRGFLGKLFGCF